MNDATTMERGKAARNVECQLFVVVSGRSLEFPTSR